MAKRRGNHEGAIFKRPNGRWQAQVTIKGKRITKTLGTQKECRDWIREINKQKEKGLSISSSRTTYGGFLQRWLEDIKTSLRPRTWYQYEGIVRNHIRPDLGETKLMDLHPEIIQRLYTTKSKHGVGSRTIRLIHAVIHRSLEIAKKQGLIGLNPAQAVDKPKVTQKEIGVLNEYQAQQLLIAAQGDRIETLLHLALTTGMRQGEILGLKWVDIDWVSSEIQVVRQLQRVQGQGFVFSSPKTKAGRRMIKLGPGTIRQLGQHLDRQEIEKQWSGSQWQENGLIFASPRGTPLEQKYLHREFKKLLKKAGLSDIRFHDLRHTAATLMLLSGVPILVVSRRLGHAKVSTTLDIYGHFIPGMQDKAAVIMDELVSPIAADLQQKKELAE